jgi:hypothetical protein
MNSINRFVSLGLACASLLTISRSAEAYIDAGSGSYLLQIALAGLLAGTYMAKSAFINFKAAIVRKIHPVKPDDSSTHVG